MGTNNSLRQPKFSFQYFQRVFEHGSALSKLSDSSLLLTGHQCLQVGQFHVIGKGLNQWNSCTGKTTRAIEVDLHRTGLVSIPGGGRFSWTLTVAKALKLFVTCCAAVMNGVAANGVSVEGTTRNVVGTGELLGGDTVRDVGLR